MSYKNLIYIDYAFYDSDGNSYLGDDPFMSSLASALKEIGKGNHGSSLLDYLQEVINIR